MYVKHPAVCPECCLVGTDVSYVILAVVLGISNREKAFRRNAACSLVASDHVAREQNISFEMKQLCLACFANAPSLRAQYGTEIPFNAVHGSRDREAASRELALLFPSFKFSDQAPEATLGKSWRQVWSLLNL